MKRLMLAFVVLALGGLATAAMAGDYHVGSLLICSDCHVMHGSKTHASSAGDSTYNFPYAAGPYNKLLRAETVNNACLACHDGRTDVPDVLCDSPNPPPNGRRAGALNVDPANTHGLSNTGTYGPQDGHTLFSTTLPPGLTGGLGTPPAIGAEGLECTSCHGAHGNKYYRNMNGAAGTAPSYISSIWSNKEVNYQIGGTPMDTAWVYEALPHNYDDANVNYQEPDPTRSAYGEWCGSCHGSFHGAPGSGNIGPAGDEVRHPTAGADIASTDITKWANTNTTHRLKLMDATGKWAATTGLSTTMTPSCFTCHKSHGNNNPYGLIFVIPTIATNGPAPAPTRSAAMTEEGDGGQLRDMCRNCHGMGTFPKGAPTNIQ